MKKVFHHGGLIGLFLSIILFSCKKDFLEITPKNKFIASKTVDYDNLLYNINAISIEVAIPMGDEIAAVQPYFPSVIPIHTRIFRWEDDIYDSGQPAPEYMEQLSYLYMYNKVINEVMASTGGTEQQKKTLQAEALANRAWAYFWLINLYGKPYNASTSAADPGFPIIKEADATETRFTRASVKEVYDFIVDDLKNAISILPTTTYRTRMSKAAAEGLLGKVYVFMGKYNEALDQFNVAFADMSSSSIPLGLYDYNVTLGPGGSFLPLGAFGPNLPPFIDSKENVLARRSLNLWSSIASEIVIEPQAVALFGSSDLRRHFYSATPSGSSSAYPLGMLRRRGPTSIEYGVVVPDLYLLRAETKARLNDLAGATADVETLRKNRMPAADALVPADIASDRAALVKFIMEERIREFAVQGYRWFDMRRLSVDPEFSATVGTTHTLYSASGDVASTFTLRPERLVLRFPRVVMEQNPGMQNNP